MVISLEIIIDALSNVVKLCKMVEQQIYIKIRTLFLKNCLKSICFLTPRYYQKKKQ